MNWKYNHEAESILEALNIADDVKKLLLTIGPTLETDKEIDSDSKFIEAFLKQVKATSDLLDTPQSIFNIGMFTMCLAFVGSNLFNRGSWMIYLGLFLMLISLATVWKYLKNH